MGFSIRDLSLLHRTRSACFNEAIDGYPMRGFSWLSYGRYDKVRFSDKEKNEIEELLLGYGRQWLRNNDFEILESIH